MARPVTWDPRHLDTVQSWVGRFLPALVPRPVRTVLCADGYTVDETGLLGSVPGLDGVVVAVGFSGHGFKMASSLGAVAADLIADGTTATDISFMDPGALPAAGADPRRPPPGRCLSRGALMTEIPPYVLGDLTVPARVAGPRLLPGRPGRRAPSRCRSSSPTAPSPARCSASPPASTAGSTCRWWRSGSSSASWTRPGCAAPSWPASSPARSPSSSGPRSSTRSTARTSTGPSPATRSAARPRAWPPGCSRTC